MENIDRLYDFIEVSTSIMCSSCRETNEIFGVCDYDAAEQFNNSGWVATKFGNVYCPECAKKKLKSKKK